MEIVALLLRRACAGRLELHELPEQIVPHRLKELHWTFGDGVFLGAICRGRGTPLDVGSEINLDENASNGGAQLLGGLLYSHQVRLSLCIFCPFCLFVRSEKQYFFLVLVMAFSVLPREVGVEKKQDERCRRLCLGHWSHVRML